MTDQTTILEPDETIKAMVAQFFAVLAPAGTTSEELASRTDRLWQHHVESDQLLNCLLMAGACLTARQQIDVRHDLFMAFDRRVEVFTKYMALTTKHEQRMPRYISSVEQSLAQIQSLTTPVGA